MKKLNHFNIGLWLKLTNLRRNVSGQDLIEYALMAGFCAVAAGAIMPGVATSINSIFNKIASIMTAAAATS
jgi:pilus assembly protein Flp/PilA